MRGDKNVSADFVTSGARSLGARAIWEFCCGEKAKPSIQSGGLLRRPAALETSGKQTRRTCLIDYHARSTHNNSGNGS